jgi:acylglycerol lipase
MVLSFATRTAAPPAKETISLLSGVIASSPLVRVADNQPSPFMRAVLKIVAKLCPKMPVNTPIQDDVSR